MHSSYLSKKIVLLNLILTVLIVLLHAMPASRFEADLSGNPLVYWTFGVCNLAVPMFFFISGFLFYRTVSADTLSDKLRRRVGSLIVPFIIWNLFFTALYALLSNIPAVGLRMHMAPLPLEPLSLLSDALSSRFTPLWFVLNLIIYTAAAPLILALLRRPLVALLMLGVSFSISFSFQLSYENPLFWLPAYTTGACLGHYFPDWRLPLDSKTARGLQFVSIAIIVSLLAWWHINSDARPLRLLSPLPLWISTDLLFGAFIARNFQVKAWMSTTFFIYCTHRFLLSLIQKPAALILADAGSWQLALLQYSSAALAILILISVGRRLSPTPLYGIATGRRHQSPHFASPRRPSLTNPGL